MNALSNDVDPDSMSIIPYDAHREVILRNANSIVVRDPHSGHLMRLDPNHGVEISHDRRRLCPSCHRPLSQDGHLPAGDEAVEEFDEQPDFINRDYFRMLAQSSPSSTQSSVPPSPQRRLVQPVRTRQLGNRESLPPDAEFVGSSPAPPSQAHGISDSAFSQGYFKKFFLVEKELGRGGRGVVLLVKHMLDGVTLGHFACKRVPIGDDHAWLEKVLVEVQLLQTLSHQNLVSYRHVWLEDYQLNTFGPSVPCAFILQQFCNGGDLHNFICSPAQASVTTQDLKERIRRRSKGEMEMPQKLEEMRKLQFDQIYAFFRDITDGLRFLHANRFLHRDLKPSNCLLHTIGHETRVLVSDFGEVQYEYVARKSTGATGTISYCAPEVLQRLSPDGPLGNFTFKSDIFSLGMILHFLCFATLPYHYADVLHEEREDVDKLRAEITSWHGFDAHRRLRPELPDKLYDFLQRLLAINPDSRPTADEVVHGIRAGGLDQVPSLRRRNSASPEELTPGRRVQPVETPVRDRSPTKVPDKQQSSSATHARILPPHLRRRQLPRDPPSIDGQMSRTPSQEAHSTNAARQEVILRSQPTSPTSSPRQSLSPPPAAQLPLLLPPPTSVETVGLGRQLLRPVTSRLLRMFVLCAKLISLLQPCIWRACSINPLAAYPIMICAVLETTIAEYQLWQMILAAIIHMMVTLFALRTQTLCLPRRDNIWVDD